MFGWIKNIGLSWKVQLAPAFLILFLIGVGAYALLALRSNQAAVDALVSGPVRQSELANELTIAAWTAYPSCTVSPPPPPMRRMTRRLRPSPRKPRSRRPTASAW